MKQKYSKGAALVLGLAVVAACTEVTPTDAPLLEVAADHTGFLPGAGHLEVCKTGVGSGSFHVSGSGQVRVEDGGSGTTVTTIDETFSLSAGQCNTYVFGVHVEPDVKTTASVTVTETPDAGFGILSVTQQRIAGNTAETPTASSNGATFNLEDDIGWKVTFENEPVIVPLDGRMTGGGSIFDGNDDSNPRFTHGFELHCDPDDPRQNLQINWDGGNFHLLDLTFGLCYDDPAHDPLPRRTDINTFEGEGTGRFNGVPGATIQFVLTDRGEPGRNDTAVWTITDAGGTIVADGISGNVMNGNHQAHLNNGNGPN